MRRTPRASLKTLSTLAIVIALGAWSRATGGEAGRSNPGRPHFLQRLHPAGGWHPDGGGLLHWWDPCCFPRCGGPDDYCRKPPPRVCWPPYPPYYIGVPACVGPPCNHGPGECTGRK